MFQSVAPRVPDFARILTRLLYIYSYATATGISVMTFDTISVNIHFRITYAVVERGLVVAINKGLTDFIAVRSSSTFGNKLLQLKCITISVLLFKRQTLVLGIMEGPGLVAMSPANRIRRKRCNLLFLMSNWMP